MARHLVLLQHPLEEIVGSEGAQARLSQKSRRSRVLEVMFDYQGAGLLVNRRVAQRQQLR